MDYRIIERGAFYINNATDRSVYDTQPDYDKITEWLPTSEYERIDAPTIEWTESYDFSKPNRKIEIWVPVHKRS